MSLCHGPGCRREQVVPYWCSERCEQRWNGHWGKSLPADLLLGDLPGEATRERIERSFVEAAIAAEPPFKLTRGQWLAACAVNPTYPAYAGPGTFAGIPVVLVDTVEESTLGAAFPQVASEDPQVARGWLSRLLGRMYGRGTPQ